MAWQNDVPSCFGTVDMRFANDPLDAERAQRAIEAAKAARASRDDFEKEMVWHIYKNITAQGLLEQHIKEQVWLLHKMW